MAYVELTMWEVLEVLKLIEAGNTVRATWRKTGRSRKTIDRYVEAAEDLGWVRGVHPVDEELAGEVASLIRPGPRKNGPTDSEALLSPFHSQIEAWLQLDSRRDGLKLTKVHQLLIRQDVDVTYSTLYRYCVKHFSFGRNRGTVRLADTKPGETVEVDFGRMGLLYDSEEDRNRVVHALIVTLTHSRHQYVHLCFTQTITDFICGLEDAFEFFGGVPEYVVLDNLRAAVKKAHRYTPELSRTFSEYAAYRGFETDPTEPAAPTQKPKVERGVPYVRENFFKGEQFLNLEQAQREAVKWCHDIAGMRIHGTTRKQPVLEFYAREQQTLQPLTKERFDIPNWGTPKVHPDCHVRFLNALYSVHFKYRGKKTVVRGDSKLVRIYIDNQQVKTHPRQPEGGRSTDYENDYPKEQTAYTMRDPNRIIAQAKVNGFHIGEFAEHLLGGRHPWSKIRQGQKLVKLCEKYGETVVDAACRRALHFELIDVQRVERIIKQALDKKKTDPSKQNAEESQVIQLPLRFARSNASFNHNHKECKNDGTE
jgi:transposase